MDVFPKIDLDVVSIVLLVVILFNSRKKLHTITKDKVTKVFISMIIVTIIILTLEILSIVFQFYNFTNLLFFNKLVNILGFILIPIVFILWILYLKSWISLKFNYILLSLPAICNLIASLLSFKYPLIFYIDNNAQYHRGPLFVTPVIISYIYLGYGLMVLLKNKKLLDAKEFRALVNFAVFPSITALLQLASSEYIIIWSGLTAAIILFYLFLLERIIMYDQLTNALNRVAFESTISSLINTSHKDFSMIFIDLDDFKKVNDTYGHAEGDESLINVVKLLKNTFNNYGQVFRFGGDEFVVILKTKDICIINTIINKLTDNLETYNIMSKKPYAIKLSYGFDVFNDDFDTFYEYIQHLDKLMYKNKNSKREGSISL